MVTVAVPSNPASTEVIFVQRDSYSGVSCVGLQIVVGVKLAVWSGASQHVRIFVFNAWPIKFNEAARELRRIGPAGESCVWPILKNENHVVATAGIRLLGEIGTRQSLPHLENLRDHRLLQPHVIQAIRTIEAAGREPARWADEV